MAQEVAQQAAGTNLTVPQIKAQIQTIQQVLKAVMKKDVHFGEIPGTNKPTLLKAGSEVILTTFRIAVEPAVEDLSNGDEYRYRVKANGVHIPTGAIIGTGVGEAGTNEEKYKWRSAVCDAEFNETPEDRRRTKWFKGSKGGSPYPVKQVRTNPADLANTVLKMAKKRAQIDLTLSATACSDIFSQDLDEMPEGFDPETGEQLPPGGKPAVTPPQKKAEAQPQSGTAAQEKAAPDGNVKLITEGQMKMLFAKMKSANIEIESFQTHFGIDRIKDLPMDSMNDALGWIEKKTTEGAQ